jgi:hypothetical protein
MTRKLLPVMMEPLMELLGTAKNRNTLTSETIHC